MHILQTERNIREFLSEAVLTLADCDDIDIVVTTFQEAGVVSADEGILLRAGPPGAPEFKISIVLSR